MRTDDIVSRADAQARADEIQTFRRELIRLDAADVLTLDPVQRTRVDNHHDRLLATLASRFDIDRDPSSRQLSLGMRIASFLGALALATSVFFLFHRYWGYFDETVQVVILVGSALLSFAAPFLIATRDPSRYFTKLAALVAFACFVLDVAMLGSIFNLTPTDRALLPWAALAFLLAYTFDLRLLLAAGIGCIAAFIAARTATWGGTYWISFGERPETFLLPALLLFAVPSLVRHARRPDFVPVYHVLSLLMFFLPVLVLSNWGAISYLDFDSDFIEGAYQLVGFFGSAGVIWIGVRRRWTSVVNTGVALFVLFLYTKLFDWWWQSMPKWLFFFVMALTAVLLLLVFRRLRTETTPKGAIS